MVTIEISSTQLHENNISSLKQRKKEFKQDVIGAFSLAGFVFIVVLYLKDTSFLRFIVRFVLHGVYTDPFPKSFTQQFTEVTKKRLIKSMFAMAAITNGLFLFLDMISGVPGTVDDMGYLYGSISLQVIGERPPVSVASYIYYNTIIAVCQLILIYLTTILNIVDELEKTNIPIDETCSYSMNQIEGDGYTGITNVTKIKPIEIYNKVHGYDWNETPEEATTSDEAYNNFMADRFSLTNMM